MSDSQDWTDEAVRWARRIANESGRPRLCVRSVDEHADVFAVIGPVAEFNDVHARLIAAKLAPIGRGQSWPIVFVMFVRAGTIGAVEAAAQVPTATPAA